jgi:hypothetical protein
MIEPGWSALPARFERRVHPQSNWFMLTGCN